MTMFIYVDDNRTSPTEDEISERGSQNDGETQPKIIGHKDQHQTIRDK